MAEFISSLNFDLLPDNVVKKAKETIIDYLAATLAGYTNGSVLSNELIKLVSLAGGSEEATILGMNKKVPVLNASLVNGVLSHVVELDDGHKSALGHPGVTAVTASITLGEFLGVSGKEILTAIVAGYDVFIRIGSAINPSHLAIGFHTTGTCGVFAAAASASKILNLNTEQTANALGLAGIQGAGLMEVTEDGQMAKALHPGKSAQAGVLAALLAKMGVQGPKTIIEGVKGFVKAMSDECDYNLMLENLGKEYHILDCYVKLYPSCRHTHAPVDCVLALREQKNFSLEEIEKIIVKTYPAAINLTGKIFKPKTPAAAKFSIPYCISAALVEGKVGLGQFIPEKLKDLKILNLVDKVKIELDPTTEKRTSRTRGAEVQIILKTGCILKKRVDLPKGEVETPISLDDLKKKFVYCTEGLFDVKKVDEIINNLNKLETVDNFGKIISSLA